MLTNTFKKLAHFANDIGHRILTLKVHLTGPSFYLFKISNTNFDHWHITYGQIEPFTFGDAKPFKRFKVSETLHHFAQLNATNQDNSKKYTMYHKILQHTFTYASYWFWDNLMAGQIPGRVGLQGQVPPCPALQNRGQRSRQRWTWTQLFS